jgi:hypothetical protein
LLLFVVWMVQKEDTLFWKCRNEYLELEREKEECTDIQEYKDVQFIFTTKYKVARKEK